MAVISPAPEEGLLRSLNGCDDLHLFGGKHYEGEVNMSGEIWHNGEWCHILRRVANIYFVEKKNS